MANQTAVIVNFPSRDTAEPAASGATVASATTAAISTGYPTSQVQAQSGLMPTSRSTQLVTIQNLGQGRVLLHPLYVSVDQPGDEWLAISNDLSLVGRGESELDAVDDLREAISELFGSLSEMRHELGPLMLDQLAFLERLSGL